MKKFKDKVALITGAARGVGEKTAILFAEAGANVFISDINFELLKKIEGNIASLGVGVKSKKTDISKIDQVNEMVSDAINCFGRIDILVNNAGVSFAKRMMELTEEDWDRVLGINVKGTFFVTKAVAKEMLKNNITGSIVNVSSIAGEKGRPNFFAYAASKAAVINMTMSSALEFAKYGIRVNSVAPGTIDTPMWRELSVKLSEMENINKDKLVENWISRIPLKRLAKPEDIAKTILYLCSEDASYITG